MAERKRSVGAWFRSLSKKVLVLSVLGFAVWGASWYIVDSHQADLLAMEERWGAEVFAAIHEGAILDGLIKPANACGMGASSCFRCHNGARAAAPGDQPWHSQHAGVNDSCVGCHNGNPRIMRTDMSHRNLIENPLSKPGESCATCHRGAEAETLLHQYLKLQN